MQANSEFGFEQLITELLRGLADAVADRPGESEAQRFARHQTAIFSIMAFHPRDAIETMLAGQCVMFDLLLRDAARDLLRNETAPGKLRIRSQIAALAKIFLKHLEQLGQLRGRPEQQSAASPPAEPEPMPKPVHMSEPVRQSANAAASQPAEFGASSATAEVEPSASGKADQLLQRGFQNRRARRALQFKKPTGKASSRRSAQIAVVSQSATGSDRQGAPHWVQPDYLTVHKRLHPE
jgi:hypothetical protein